MEFASEAQKQCYERIVPWLREVFGGAALVREDRPVIGVARGSAFAQVGVFPWGDADAIITTRAYVVADADLNEELLRFLLHENGGMHFGAFGIDDDGDIFFEHSIVGSTCDKKEIEASVTAVVRAADDYDDLIVARWGGRRALDQAR
jgi:T3SS (YopN, CesT) and YbjN peptide-binding chaperone 1